MTIQWREQLRPGVALREIVQQATAALVRMDADRLEELALCCADLHCELRGRDVLTTSSRFQSDLHGDLWHELEEAGRDLEVLRRVLRETRANLTVFTRLQAIRLRDVGHEGKFKGGWEWAGEGS
jgi:hypothetical protein